MIGRIRFLSVDNILQIHEDTINEEGGLPGLRDRNLLESAVAMPRSSFGGQYAHEDLAAMAAAYLFHLYNNHPFLGGNKRAAAFFSLLFLVVNGIPDDALPEESQLEKVTFALAQGKAAKQEATEWFRTIIGVHPVAGNAREE